MHEVIETVKSMVEMGLFNQPRKTENELRTMIRGVAGAIAPNFGEAEIEQIARSIEHKQGIKAGLGAIVDGEDFEPWLNDAKPSIEPFYWNRYQKLLLQNDLPKDVVISTDKVTDKILSRLGNPNNYTPWDRRGMVVGHVQSGKTANYTGLICKAADAGYRLIIVIAGIHNNLRNQTQIRIDEGFIGRDTGKSESTRKGLAKHIIGVGNFDSNNTPVSLTNTLRDFNKATASTNTSEIDSYKVPVILVIKKNVSTLKNLLQWLKDNSARGDNDMVDQPMLLIDDEADNASINTKYSRDGVTTTNRLIRELLNTFHRSCYVGYTATPFANIFIDPDQDDEMHNEDLFPRDFILGLDAPSNYFGASKIFVDGLPEGGEPTWLRFIADNEDVLPVKHPQDFNVEALPESLLKAVRSFLVAATIRNMRDQGHKHGSMLVNASFRNPIQLQLRNKLHEALKRIQDSVRINGALIETDLVDPEIAALKQVWRSEYENCHSSWTDIQKALHETIAAAEVVLVNKDSKDVLDFPKEVRGKAGKKYIAVGGYSLSRGLTLEGLTVTWFLRNTMMYDTLMQMGRWFGYRGGYEDLCRIWMPVKAIDWYSFIANATEELHDELRTMEKAKATPQMFGLAVRSHPASLLVTARNKMGSGKKVTTLVGLSNKFVETTRVSIRNDDIRANTIVAKRLVQELKSGCFEEHPASAGVCVMNVPIETVDRFLAGWRNAEQSVTSDPGPIRQYIRARRDNELPFWDVLITGKKSGAEVHDLGRPIKPIARSFDPIKLKDGFIAFGGGHARVADGSFEKAGLGDDLILKVEQQYRLRPEINKNRPSYPGWIYRSVRERPLLMIMLVKPLPINGIDGKQAIELIPAETVVTWGISLPVSSRPTERVEYVVNTVRYRELFGEEDEDEDQESALDAS